MLEDEDVVGGVGAFPVGEVCGFAAGGLFEEAYEVFLFGGDVVAGAWCVAPGVSFVPCLVCCEGSGHGVLFVSAVFLMLVSSLSGWVAGWVLLIFPPSRCSLVNPHPWAHPSDHSM